MRTPNMTTVPFQSGSKKRPVILLIDAERDLHTVLDLILSHSGTGRLLSSLTGLEGIEMARRAQPDVILLETRLSDLDGDLVFRILNSHPSTSSIPVILFTARASDLDRFDGLAYAEAVLKPFCTQKLCSIIRRVTDTAHGGKSSRNAPAMERAWTSSAGSAKWDEGEPPSWETDPHNVTTMTPACPPHVRPLPLGSSSEQGRA